MPKVSVIIPTHNRAEYLRGAIKSVLNQTFQDFEIIIVDDASKDNTADVVSSFDDSRVNYIRLDTNKGGSAARNAGILNSTCDYIAFLDDDDEWLSEKLRLQVNLIEDSPATVGIIYTGYVAVDRSTGEVLDQRLATRRGDLSKELLSENWVGSPSSVLLRRECFKRAGLFDESLPSFQDHDMWIRISRHFLVDYVSEPLFTFYCHKSRIWTNLEALSRGMDIMLSKHGHSGIVRRHFSYRYLFLGVRYCEAGNTKKSMEAFLKAIGLHPFEIRHYFNLCLSLLGPKYFRKLKETKEKFLDPLRGHAPRFPQ